MAPSVSGSNAGLGAIAISIGLGVVLQPNCSGYASPERTASHHATIHTSAVPPDVGQTLLQKATPDQQRQQSCPQQQKIERHAAQQTQQPPLAPVLDVDCLQMCFGAGKGCGDLIGI